jgi:hypothetical protein
VTRRILLGGLRGLVLVGLLTNLALGLSYQRERGSDVPGDWHREFLRWRQVLPGSQVELHRDEDQINPRDRSTFPRVRDGAILVIGDCERVYSGLGMQPGDADPDRPAGEWVEVDDPYLDVCKAAL